VKSFSLLAASIEHKTAADDESVLSGIATLANFKLNAKQLRELIPLVVDYARRSGKDVPEAAGLIGRAFLGNARALKTVGIQFKATGDTAKDFATITDALRSKVGGFAEREGKTSAGQLAILKNRFEDLQEVIGAKVITVLTFLIQNFRLVAPAILGLVTAFQLATSTTVIFGVALNTLPFIAIGTAVVLLATLIILNWGKVKRFTLKTFEAITAFFRQWWPVILVVATGGLGVILVAFIKNFSAIKGAVLAVMNAVKATITGTIRAIIAFFHGVGGAISEAFISPFRTAYKTLVGFFQAIWNWIQKIANAIPNLVNKIPGVGIAKKIGGWLNPFGEGQEGAIVTRPTWSLIGEAGPEALIPLNRMPGARPLPESGGGRGRGAMFGDIHINVGGRGTPQDISRELSWLARIYR
jgi:hypothetical protein